MVLGVTFRSYFMFELYVFLELGSDKFIGPFLTMNGNLGTQFFCFFLLDPVSLSSAFLEFLCPDLIERTFNTNLLKKERIMIYNFSFWNCFLFLPFAFVCVLIYRDPIDQISFMKTNGYKFIYYYFKKWCSDNLLMFNS
jgi:hypothetical protein